METEIAMTEAESLAELIRTEAVAVAPRVKEIREDLHRHPELRFQEFRTAEVCAREMESLGIDVRRGVGETGVVGVLRGTAQGLGRTVAFRAEMDALAIDDRCGQPYASETPGVGHLCGHDGHVAALLGMAMVLSKLRDLVPGNVKFFFEPAEEDIPPGDRSGAEAMISDGALEDPSPDAVFGGHFFPEWPAGSIALRVGPAFTGNDSWRLTIVGRQAHVAAPHEGLDAILVAGHIITALQGLASQFDIGEAVTMHVSTISGGQLPNLIAERVEMRGMFRISDEGLRDEMAARFERMVKGICDSFGATYELDYKIRNLRAVISTPREVEIMTEALREVLGPERTIQMRHPRLAGDTMDHWLNRRPGVFFMVGSANDDPATQYPSHHPRFDIAPETWPAAVAGMCMTAIRYLESE